MNFVVFGAVINLSIAAIGVYNIILHKIFVLTTNTIIIYKSFSFLKWYIISFNFKSILFQVFQKFSTSNNVWFEVPPTIVENFGSFRKSSLILYYVMFRSTVGLHAFCRLRRSCYNLLYPLSVDVYNIILSEIIVLTTKTHYLQKYTYKSFLNSISY